MTSDQFDSFTVAESIRDGYHRLRHVAGGGSQGEFNLI